VETIGTDVFQEGGLTSIVIPASVKSIGKGALAYCYYLETVFYLGTEDLSEEIFSASTPVTSMCVSPDYKSDHFCGAAVTHHASACESFESLFNHCYEGKYVDGVFSQIMRENASQYELHTDNCAARLCVNETGAFAWSTCNKTAAVSNMCVNQQCVDSGYFVKKYSVVAVFNEKEVKTGDVNFTTVAVDINNLTGIDISVFVVGGEFDDEGYAIDVIVFVDEEDLAVSIKGGLDSMDKGAG